MKKIVLMSFTLCLMLISCGKKNKEVEGTSSENNSSDCNCSDLNIVTLNADGEKIVNWKDIKKNGSNELYTGSCIEKDQYDSIVKKIEIKNGWVIRKVLREKVNDLYITTFDYTYENAKEKDGWDITIDRPEDDNLNLFPNYYHVKFMTEMKNGKVINKWYLYLENNEKNSISLHYYFIDGKEIKTYNELEIPPLKCLSNAVLEEWWDEDRQFQYVNTCALNDISPDDFFKTITSLKTELKHFDYWKMK